MTDDMNTQAKVAAANWVAEAVHTLLADIEDATGWPPSVILSGAHALIISELALALGGRMAAAMARQSADRVCDLPSRKPYSLADAPPVGRA